MGLDEKSCIPCRGGIPPMSADEAKQRLSDVPGWELIDDAEKLSRMFKFDDFIEAQDFAIRVGDISEAENHHPVVTYSWGWCKVVFYTHKIDGLHDNDFVMAAKVSALI